MVMNRGSIGMCRSAGPNALPCVDRSSINPSGTDTNRPTLQDHCSEIAGGMIEGADKQKPKTGRSRDSDGN